MVRLEDNIRQLLVDNYSLETQNKRIWLPTEYNILVELPGRDDKKNSKTSGLGEQMHLDERITYGNTEDSVGIIDAYLTSNDTPVQIKYTKTYSTQPMISLTKVNFVTAIPELREVRNFAEENDHNKICNAISNLKTETRVGDYKTIREFACYHLGSKRYYNLDEKIVNVIHDEFIRQYEGIIIVWFTKNKKGGHWVYINPELEFKYVTRGKAKFQLKDKNKIEQIKLREISYN